MRVSSICCASLLLALLFVSSVYGGWQLTFSEEFNGQKALNTSVWNTMYSFNAVINSELEYYASDAFTFTNTTMKITANKASVTTDLGNFAYTSGLITTKHKFSQTYGYFELYGKVPQGYGFWPAFWLLPEPPGGSPQEIDVMEMVMNLPDDVYTTWHCNYSTGGSLGYTYSNASFSTGFHTFAVQWIPNNLYWYLDGVQIFSVNSACVPNRPEYILANLAVGGSWPAPPNSATPWPSYFEIDHIRAYKYVASGGISIPGPGNGISFTPTLDALPFITISNPVASPQNTSPGKVVTFSVTVSLSSSVAYSNMNFQFVVHNLTDSLTTLTVSGVNIPAGSPAVHTVSTTYTIPAGEGTGYMRVTLGVFSSSWANLFWEENVWVVGVNKVVGA